MTIEFTDATGKPRADADIEQAIEWVSRRIVKPDFSDPAGVIHCVTIRGALLELLQMRAAIRKATKPPGEGGS